MENKREEEIKRGWISRQRLKSTVHFYSILYFICSTALIGISAWMIINKFEYVPLMKSNDYQVSIYFCMALGLIAAALSVIGLIAASKENHTFVCLYGVMLTFALMANGVLLLYTYRYMETIGNEASGSLKTQLIRDHSVVPAVTEAFEKLHLEGKCCGATLFENWRDSVWWQKVNTAQLSQNRHFDLVVPEICCRTPSSDCGRRDHPSNIYYEGCARYFVDHVQQQLSIICFTILIVSLIEFSGAGFVVCLHSQLKQFSASNSRRNRLYNY